MILLYFCLFVINNVYINYLRTGNILEFVEMTVTKEKELLKDYELIEAHKKGDSEALDILLTRYKNYIFNLSYRFMHNYEDAMDLTQDVLIRVYKAIDRYEERNYFKGWWQNKKCKCSRSSQSAQYHNSKGFLHFTTNTTTN